MYTQSQIWKLEGFLDNDWGGASEDRKSTLEMVFSLGSGVVSWSSKKQNITKLSTTEVEYMALTPTTCQAISLKRVLEDYRQAQSKPTTIWCDNKSTIALAKNPTMHGRTKRIDINFTLFAA